jgi:transposase
VEGIAVARRRFEVFQYRQVLVRLRQGDTDRQIARSGLMGRRKLAAFRSVCQQHGWLDSTAVPPEDATIAAAVGRARRARSTISTAEPFRELVSRWTSQGVSGVAIHAALCREHGYTGSYSAIYRLIQSLGEREPDATVPLQFAPAEAAQVDFGAGPILSDTPGARERRTWCFVMTLCFSRHQYLEFVFDQTVATWLGCHRRAFEWFGRVPDRLIIDNPKCAITRACMHDPIVQRSYAECAEGYGFRIEACPPADPAKKGIVESGVKYVKGNFLPLRQFRDLSDLNAQSRDWVVYEAGVRIHGSTREQPLSRFELERPLMRPLPAVAPDLGVWTQVSVHRDCHVQFEKSLYSVPFTLVGQRLWLRATDNTVTVFKDHHLIATHPRARTAATRRTVREHLPPQAQLFFAHDRSWCAQQARQIGPACTQLIDQLLGDRIRERLRAAQGVLRMSTRYGEARLEAACARALAHDSPHYRTVRTILIGGHDLRSDPIQSDPSQTYLQQARFARAAHELFGAEPATEDFVSHPVAGTGS